MTTLSNKHETGAQFTTHGTLWRGTAKSDLDMLFDSTVTNTATLWHKLILSETKDSILFSKAPNRGFHIWFFTIKPLIKTGINKDIASLHQHKKICVPVDAAYGWNLILMNLTIKLNNHQFFPYYCLPVWMELDGCQLNALEWLKKSGRGEQMTNSLFCLQWYHQGALEQGT